MAIKINVKPLEVPIVRFGDGAAEGDSDQKELLGGKGANLCGMSKQGIPVPPGFIIPTTMCAKYTAASQDPEKFEKFCDALKVSIVRGLKHINSVKGQCLVSVRSGARVSMPGMMDTILNVGITPGSLEHWEKPLGPRAAWDSYRRLYQMYGSVAYGIPMAEFDTKLNEVKISNGLKSDADMDFEHILKVMEGYKLVYEKHQMALPKSMEEQVLGAALAVFESWNNPRAKEYRKIHNIPEDWGTAVTVQAMVFGNMNDNSATGVLFSRDPSTGLNVTTGEYLVNAQGEDVVAGIRTPEPIAEMGKWNMGLLNQLHSIVQSLEVYYKDMQDVEFTVEDGTLYLLQTRNGKRSAKAAFTIAYDLAMEGLITKEVAGKRVTAEQLKAVMSDTIDPSFTAEPHVVGIAAGGSVVTGVAMFTAEDAVNCTEPCILVTDETDPDDIAGMNAAVGILTATGGLTSHAAVVARGMNKACVVGASSLKVSGGVAFVSGSGISSFTSGQKITIDGSTGNVWVGVDVPVIKGEASEQVMSVVTWALGKEDSPMNVYIDMSMSEEEMMTEVSKAPGKVRVELGPIIGAVSHKIAGKEVCATMERLGKVAEKSGKEFVLNFKDARALLPEEDKVYFDLFGISESANAHQTTAAAKALLGWVPEALSRVMVTGDVPDAIKYYAGPKPKMCLEVTSFADLINSNGPVSVSDEVVAKVFGGKEYFDKAVELVEGTGVNLSGALAASYYWYDLFDGANDAADSNA